MTPDLSEFESLNSRIGRNRCTVRTAADRLSDSERDTYSESDCENYLASLARPWEGEGKVEHAAISRWLRKRGVNISQQTIGRHRLGGCGCNR